MHRDEKLKANGTLSGGEGAGVFEMAKRLIRNKLEIIVLKHVTCTKIMLETKNLLAAVAEENWAINIVLYECLLCE